MSATFWNMRRRLAAEKARNVEKHVDNVDKHDDAKAVETVEKPKKGKVKKDGD